MSANCVVGKFYKTDDYCFKEGDFVEQVQYLLEDHQTDIKVVLTNRIADKDDIYLLCADQSPCSNCSVVEARNAQLTDQLESSNKERDIMLNRWKNAERIAIEESRKSSNIQDQFLELMNKFNSLEKATKKTDDKLKSLEVRVKNEKTEYEKKITSLEEKLKNEKAESNEKIKDLHNDINCLFKFTLTQYYALASEVLNHFIGWTGEEFEVKRFSYANQEHLSKIGKCLEGRAMTVEIFQERENQLVTTRHRLLHFSDVGDLKLKIADALEVADKVVSNYPNDVLLCFAVLVLELSDILLP